MRRRIIEGAILSLTVLVAPAQAVNLDFDAASGGTYLTIPYEEDGFRITVLFGHYDIWTPSCLPGPGCPTSNYLAVDSSFGNSAIRLTTVSGANFDLFGFTKLFACGQPVCATLTSSNGGLAPLTSQGAWIFGGVEWRNLAWVEIAAINEPMCCNYVDASLDDINVAPIPVPAAIWLFGGALGLLGLAKRRSAAHIERKPGSDL